MLGKVVNAKLGAVDPDFIGTDTNLDFLLQCFLRAVLSRRTSRTVVTETHETECLHTFGNLLNPSTIPRTWGNRG